MTAEKAIPSRAMHEIEHGRKLAAADVETMWGWGTHAGRLRMKRRAALIARGAGLVPGLRVLEIGCGTGLFTEAFAAFGVHLTAVDISADLLAKAHQRVLAEDQVRFLEGRFEDCTFDDPEAPTWVDGPFDAVIGSSVLHHLDVDAAIPHLYRMLKPGARLSFAEPNLLNPQIFAERTFRTWFPSVSQDETAFVRWRVRTLLRDHEFEEIDVRPFDWLHPATPKRLLPVVRELGTILESLPVVREFSGSLLIQARRPM
jgi:2-polyprenyl-3-methyl-5-hydroxy-6-metoxy-1,4-benzoquinol methylase